MFFIAEASLPSALVTTKRGSRWPTQAARAPRAVAGTALSPGVNSWQGKAAQRGQVQHELRHRRLDGGAATGAHKVLPHQGPGGGWQGAALQALDDMRGIQGVGRVEVMGLGAQGMDAGTL
jgi:hypothetical protein